MFCPKCGLQQVSEVTRFCSRCGLPVSGLAEWIAGGGASAVSVAEAPAVSVSRRRKGVRRGAKLMFFGGVLMPFFLGLSFLLDNPGPLGVPFMIIFAGLSLMLYARIFGEDLPAVEKQKAQQPAFGASQGASALPPASDVRMGGFGPQKVRTAESAQPPSVTEHTTRLLDGE